jgi:hypothetical protein
MPSVSRFGAQSSVCPDDGKASIENKNMKPLRNKFFWVFGDQYFFTKNTTNQEEHNGGGEISKLVAIKIGRH